MSAKVQGFLTELKFNSVDITDAVNDFSLDDTYTSLDKMVMNGTGEDVKLPGAHTGTMTFSGFVDTAQLAVIESAIATGVPIPYEVVILEGVTTDASYIGTVVTTTFTKSTEHDGVWSFSYSGDTAGNTFTPAAP